MSLIKQPIKYVESYDDGGFEYMPSESSQANMEDQHEEVLLLSAPSQQTYTVQQEKLSPNKIRNSNQSLVYSASSYDTEIMNSPQFGHQQQQPPQAYILVNNNSNNNSNTKNNNNNNSITKSNNVEPQKKMALQVNQMVSNLSQVLFQSSTKSKPEIQNVVPLVQYQQQPQQQQQQTTSHHPQSFRSTAQKLTEVSPTRSQMTSQVFDYVFNPQKENLNPMVAMSSGDQQNQLIQSLESQLLQERLNSEQLRVYNHIIKHELEKKLLTQGVFLIKDSSRACKQSTPTKSKRASGSKNEAAIDIYLEIQHNRIQMQALQSEFKSKDAIQQHLEVQLRQSNDINELMRRHEKDLQEQNEQLQLSVKSAMDTINKANSTIASLDDEKEGLITCIEEEENLIRDLKSKLDVELSQSEKLKQQIKSIYDQLDESKSQVTQMERNVKVEKLHASQINEELAEKDRLFHENNEQKKHLTKIIADKQREIMQYQHQLSESMDKVVEYEQANKEFSRQFNESTQQINQYKKQYDEQQSQINILNDNLEQITYEYESNMTKTDRMERQVVESERLVHERDRQLQVKEDQMAKMIKRTKHLEENQTYSDKLELKYKELQHKLHQVQKQKEQENVELGLDCQQKSQEIMTLYEQISQAERDHRDLRDSLQQVTNERQQIIEELDKMQDLLVGEQQINSKLDGELSEYRLIIHERENASAKLHALQIKYQADMEYYENVTQELQQKMNQSNTNVTMIAQSPKDSKQLPLQNINDKLVHVLGKFNLQSTTQWPIYNTEQLLQNIERLVDEIDQCLPQSDKLKKVDDVDVNSQLAVKDQEIQLYRHLINSAQVHDVVAEMSLLETQLADLHRERKDISKLVNAQQHDMQCDLTLRARSQGLLKISHLQDQLNQLQERENQVTGAILKLQEELERINTNTRTSNANKRQQFSSHSERTESYNAKNVTIQQPQSIRNMPDKSLFETFKPEPINTSIKTNSFENFYKPSSTLNDIYNVPTKQQQPQSTMSKRRYFL